MGEQGAESQDRSRQARLAIADKLSQGPVIASDLRPILEQFGLKPISFNGIESEFKDGRFLKKTGFSAGILKYRNRNIYYDTARLVDGLDFTQAKSKIDEMEEAEKQKTLKANKEAQERAGGRNNLRKEASDRRVQIANTLSSGYVLTDSDLKEMYEGKVTNVPAAVYSLVTEFKAGGFENKTGVKPGIEEYKGVKMYFDANLRAEDIDFDEAKRKIDEMVT